MPQLFGPAPAFETSRLIIRPYLSSDLDTMAAMFADPDVTAHTLLGQRDRVQTEAILDAYRTFLSENGYGMYAVLDKASGVYLGEVGTFVPPVDHEPLALRCALVRDAWGKGIAPEASVPIIDDVLDRLGFDHLIAGVVAENTGSIRVMEKLGFRLGGEREAEGHLFGIYSLHRDDWRVRQGTDQPTNCQVW